MIKKAVQIGDSIVRAKSKDIPVADIAKSSTQALIKNLVDSMRHYKLVGMAAPQIGKNLNVFVIEIRKTPTRKGGKNLAKLKVFINPKLSSLSKIQTILMEGCGSLVTGQLFGPVKRPSSLVVTAHDENGKKFQMKASGLMAKVVQHEYDHLQGIICIDKFVDTKKVMHRDEFRKRK